MFVITLTASFFSLLLGFAFATYLFRKAFRLTSEQQVAYENNLFLKEEEIRSKTKAIRQIVYETQHYGGNPVLKRFRGLKPVSAPFWKSLYENLTLLEKPNHHEFAKLATKDARQAEEIWDKAIEVALKVEEEILSTVRKVEALQ